MECGHSREPSEGICMKKEGNRSVPLHPLEKPRPGPNAAGAGQTQALGKAIITLLFPAPGWD